MQSKRTRWNGVPAQCDRLARCTRVHVHSIAVRYVTITLNSKRNENERVMHWRYLPERKVDSVRFRLDRRREKSPLRNKNNCTNILSVTVRPHHWSNGARTVPYDALLATEAPMNMQEIGTVRIDSQHPCTYERIGPPIGKVSCRGSKLSV